MLKKCSSLLGFLLAGVEFGDECCKYISCIGKGHNTPYCYQIVEMHWSITANLSHNATVYPQTRGHCAARETHKTFVVDHI